MTLEARWAVLVGVVLVACQSLPARPSTPVVKPLTDVSAMCPKAPAPTRTLKVDPAKGDDSASGVCVAAGSCTPVKTVARVATLVQPGDLVQLAGGTYDADAAFTVSGTVEKPIVFAAVEGETPIFTKSVVLVGLSFLQFRGVQFDAPNNDVWFSADEGTHDVVLVGNSFDSHAPNSNHGSFQGLNFKGRRYELCGNSFGSWLGDLLSADPVDDLVIEHNDFSQASGLHSLVAVVGRHVVIRGNVFRNPWHRVLHITDRALDKPSEDIVVENNTFIDSDWTKGDPSASKEEQFQGGDEIVRFLGARGIFRNNVLAGNHQGNNWECRGVLNFQTFVNAGAGFDVRRYTKFRVYGNVFDSNKTSSIVFYQGPKAVAGDLDDDQFKNNVLSNPEKYAVTTCNAGVPWSTYKFERNLVPGELVHFSEVGDAPVSILAMEAKSPMVFSRNLSDAPVFVNGAFADSVAKNPAGYSLGRIGEAFDAYSLANSSPGKGQAAALAHVAAAVTAGKSLAVDDALWFSDGFGLVGGDTIRVGLVTAKVLSRDVATNTLTLDTPVTAKLGDEVQLEGVADVGVHQ